MATNTTSLNAPYLLLAGVVVVAVFFLFIVLQPMMDAANTTRHSIAEDNETLKDKEAFINSLDVKTQQLKAFPDVEKQMAAMLPATDRTQDVIRVLHEYAAQSGVTVVAVLNNSPSSDAQANAERARGEVVGVPSEVKTLEFEVSISGAYQQARLFLGLLGKSPRIVDVKGVSLKQIPSQPGQVNATITMQLYFQQAQAAGE